MNKLRNNILIQFLSTLKSYVDKYFNLKPRLKLFLNNFRYLNNNQNQYLGSLLIISCIKIFQYR